MEDRKMDRANSQATMRGIIQNRLGPIMVSLFQRAAESGLDLEIDGTPVYNERAQFVGGKVINQACYTVLELLNTGENLKQLGEIIRMVSDMPMETWGILNGISGLYRLKKAGLLEQVVEEATLEMLKASMDWRTFVDMEDHYALIHKPANYYGVAFGIARYRELLGWEPEGHSLHLLNRLMEHIDRYSGDLCFMDETPGEGRFDRYSILVPSELASQLLATGWDVPEKIQKMLAKSAHIFLQLSNEEGLGFSYGRSIGAYGDTAALEVLSAAVRLEGIFTEDEKEIAYGYSMKVLEHMVDFWYDEEMKSINMWEKGRKTDNYRNKNRILGENLSLCMQMINSFEHWERVGYGDHEICGDLAQRLRNLDAYRYVPFAKGTYERGLAIVRDGGHVWSLPFISGGQRYYDKDPYMPVPFQNLVLQGVPEYQHGQLVPQLWREDGEVVMPVAYMTDIVPRQKGALADGGSFSVTCRFDVMCRMGKGIFIGRDKVTADSLIDNSVAGNSEEAERPKQAEGISDEVRYIFLKNRIRREDRFTIHEGQKVKKIRLVLLTYSKEPELKEGGVAFGEGLLSGMRAEGYGECVVWNGRSDGSFDTPHGRMNAEVVWEREIGPEERHLNVNWEIEYHSR